MALLACMVVLPAAASTVLGLTVTELARRSERVVLATVTSVTSRRDGHPAGLHTFTTLAVERSLLGGGGARVVVRQLGGRDGHHVSRVVGDARFRVGEEVVVFLRRDGRDPDLFHLTALGEAKFTVVRGVGPATVSRDLSGLDLVGPNGRPVPVAARLSLAALEADVEGAGNGGSGRRAAP